jgi:O-antigen/teichoic acid export membrane protein
MASRTVIQSLIQQSKGEKSKQILSLLASYGLGIGLGIGTSVVNTRILGADAFGDYKFIQNIFTFLMVFFSVGVFHTGGRLIAYKKYEPVKQQIIGTLYAMTGIISVGFILASLLVSYIQDAIYGNDLGYVVRLMLPLLFVFPFKVGMIKFLEGDNKIYGLSAFDITPKALYLAVLLSGAYFVTISVTSAMAIFLVTNAIAILVITPVLKPKFENMRKHARTILQENKGHGYQIYIGSLISNGSMHFGTFVISYYLDNTSVGFYNLANTIAVPLSMVPQAVGTAFFKDFANLKKIPNKVVYSTVAISLVAFVLFVLLIEYVVRLLYSEEFLPVVPLIYIVAFSYLIQGFFLVLNRFLSAHGIGKELKNASFARGIINIVGFVVLTKLFGTVGACFTLVLANMAYMAYLFVKYQQFVKGTLTGHPDTER